jgi:translin
LITLKSDLESINLKLKDLEDRRETLIKGTRDIIILCSKAIVSIHNHDISGAETILKEAKIAFKKFRHIAGIDLDKYMSVPEQELTEGLSLLHIVKHSTVPSMHDTEVAGPSYALGLLDCIGELKRIIYDKLRESESPDIENLFRIMNEIYGAIYPLAVYDNLVPGLRKKLDVSRHLIEDVRATMTEEERRKLLMKRIDSFEQLQFSLFSSKKDECTKLKG